MSSIELENINKFILIFKNCLISLLLILNFSSSTFSKDSYTKAEEFLLELDILPGINPGIVAGLGTGSTIFESLCNSSLSINETLNIEIGNTNLSAKINNPLLKSVIGNRYKIISNLVSTTIYIDRHKLECYMTNENGKKLTVSDLLQTDDDKFFLKINFFGDPSLFLDHINKISKIRIFTSDGINDNSNPIPFDAFTILQLVKINKWKPG